MSTQLTLLELDKASLTRTSLYLPENTTQDDWKKIGNQLDIMASASCWWLGDWILAGQQMYNFSLTQILEANPAGTPVGDALAKYAPQALYSIVAVCKLLPPTYRVDHPNLRFDHARCVVNKLRLANCEPADKQRLQLEAKAWLDIAASKFLTARELRVVMGGGSLEEQQEAEQVEMFESSVFAKTLIPLTHRVDRTLSTILNKTDDAANWGEPQKQEFRHLLKPLLSKIEQLLDLYKSTQQ